METEKLKWVMLDQKEVFNRDKLLIQRDLSLEKHINTRQIVIISGIRRSGKSSLLYLIKEKMGLKDHEYCYMNFDDERLIDDTFQLDDIYTLHLSIYKTEPVLFFDEIQNIRNWEKFINRMYEKGLKIFVTGSNARLLSSEISTSLTGRNKIIALYPFSFSEYLKLKAKNYNLQMLSSKQKALLIHDFEHYLEMGGFPLVLKENDTELLNSYFQDILYRDIISRYRLGQVNELREIGLYLSSNISKLFSYSTLQKISGVKSTSTIKNYLEYLEKAYLFFYLKKFDYSVRKQIMNPRKVYAIDHGFARQLGFNFSKNKGRILENIIFIELLRRKKEVYYFSGKNECDFIVKEGLDIVEAIQVAYSLETTNYDRETNGLKEAMLTYNIKHGTLIIMSKELKEVIIDDKINIVYAWEWLLNFQHQPQ